MSRPSLATRRWRRASAISCAGMLRRWCSAPIRSIQESVDTWQRMRARRASTRLASTTSSAGSRVAQATRSSIRDTPRLGSTRARISRGASARRNSTALGKRRRVPADCRHIRTRGYSQISGSSQPSRWVSVGSAPFIRRATTAIYTTADLLIHRIVAFGPSLVMARWMSQSRLAHSPLQRVKAWTTSPGW